MIRFRKWVEHNRRALNDVRDKRRKRGIPWEAPLSLQRVLIVTKLDRQFARFAALVGGATAESYFLRAIQYAADHGGHDGRIEVPRDRFGSAVLTREWHAVSRATGERVYDALLESTICVRSDDPSADRSADDYDGGPRTDDGSSADEESGERGPDAADGGAAHGCREHPPARAPGPVYARDARAASDRDGGPETGPRTGPQTCPRPPQPSPSDPPRPPVPGGGCAASPLEGSSDDAGPVLRPRLRERFGRVLDYVAQCGTGDERRDAVELRRRHRDGQVRDDEVAAALERFAWVTTERLARHRDDAGAGRGAPDSASAPPPTKPAPDTGTCARHGRPEPCTVCAVATTPAAPMPDALRRFAASAGPPPDPTPARAAVDAPTISPADREAIRLGQQLADVPADDPRHAEAQALIAERPRGSTWNERAAACLAGGTDASWLDGFGGAA